MMGEPLRDLSKLCIHTITTMCWSLEQDISHYAEAGVAGITVWRDALDGWNMAQAGESIRSAGLEVVSLCRGGFFPAESKQGREKAIDENLKLMNESAELGAPLVVLVCGAVPGMELEEARNQIREGIEAILPRAESLGIKLGIEPLHPMYADSRSAINTLKQGNDMCEAIGSESLGVVVDVYHLWWDPNLEMEIARAGRMGKILAFHISDWRTPTEDILYDRGLMGEGCIPIRKIRGWMDSAGFAGYNEVEIFSKKRWAGSMSEFLADIKEAYLNHS